MLSTSIIMAASQLENPLRSLVQAGSGAVGFDEIVVADHREDRRSLVAGVNGEVHVLLDRHGLVGTNQGPLHQVVALAVGVEAQLRRQAAAAHAVVVAPCNLGTEAPGTS